MKREHAAIGMSLRQIYEGDRYKRICVGSEAIDG